MKSIILTALVAVLSTSTAIAGDIVWRSPTAGVLSVSAAPPTTPDDHPVVPSNPPGNFGIFYGATKIRTGTSLSVQPLTFDGFPGAGYTYAVTDAPIGINVNATTGIIAGKLTAAGTYTVTINITKNGATQKTSAIIVVA